MIFWLDLVTANICLLSVKYRTHFYISLYRFNCVTWRINETYTRVCWATQDEPATRPTCADILFLLKQYRAAQRRKSFLYLTQHRLKVGCLPFSSLTSTSTAPPITQSHDWTGPRGREINIRISLTSQSLGKHGHVNISSGWSEERTVTCRTEQPVLRKC